ncbi:MAG: LamG-like jellyroll fold domain-containing protein, partial [Bacteroidota bacterium]
MARVTYPSGNYKAGDVITFEAVLENSGINPYVQGTGANAVLRVNGRQVNSTSTIGPIAAKGQRTVGVSWVAEEGEHEIEMEIRYQSDMDPSNDVNSTTITVAASEAPALATDVRSIDVTASASVEEVEVRNVGGDGPFTWTASVTSGSDWISITQGASGGAGDKIRLAVAANTSGARQGEVTVTSPQATNSPVTVSVSQEAYADVTAPAVPASVTAQASDGRVALIWQAVSDSDLARYEVLRGTSDPPTGLLTAVAAGTTSYTDEAVTNGTTYYYCVKAVDQAGNESACSSVASASPTAAANTLIVHLEMDEATGTTVADATGRGNDGVLEGSVSLGAPGVVGTAAAFEGGRIAVSRSSDSNRGADDFSVALWFKLDALQSTVLWNNRAGCSGTALWHGVVNGVLRADGRVGNGAVASVSGTTVLQQDVWYHAAAVRAGTSLKLYLNGQEEASGTLPSGADYSTDNPLWIGLSHCENQSALQGTLDEFKIFDGALSATEVEALFETYTIPGEEPFCLTSTTHAETEDLDAVVKQQCGAAAQLADWESIKQAVGTDPSALTAFFDAVGLEDGGVALVKRNDARFFSGSRHYYMQRFDSGPYSGFAVHDRIGRLYLGSWYGLTMPVLGERPVPSGPPAPQGLSAQASDGRVALTWQAVSASELARYEVLRGTSDPPTGVLAAVAAGATSYTDEAVTNGTTYYYCVKAIDQAGNESACSSVASATPDGATPPTSDTAWRYIAGTAEASRYQQARSQHRTTGMAQKAAWDMPAYNTTRMLAGNVDADAALELVTVQDNVLYVLSASGNVEHTTDVAVAGQVSSFVSLLADVDGDGVLEIGVGYNRGDSNYGDHNARLYRADGTLVQTFTKAGRFDGVMWPVESIGGDVTMVSSAGFSRDPRGFSRWNVASGTEQWLYDVGPRSNGPHAFIDYDQDGKLEMAFGNFTPHNGGSGNGTSDGDNATIIIDEEGTAELTQKYSGTQNGTLQDVFVRLNGASAYSMISFKGFSNSYRGNSKIHVRSLDGTIQHTASGEDNANWTYGWADLDGDGKVEIVATNTRVAANEVRIYDAELQVQHTYTAAEHTVQALADVDGDGFVEVILASRADASVIALSHTLEEEWRWDAPSNAPIHTAIVADLDGNNLLDIAVLTDDQVVILEGQAGG